jgi:hypothetical protein
LREAALREAALRAVDLLAVAVRGGMPKTVLA